MNDYKKCIVMVDDEPGACDFVKSFLEERGYTVHVAFNGDDGIALIKEKNPVLVFLDIRMPGKNGAVVLEELRKDDPELKVVIMTGLEEGELLDKVKELGATDILAKPVQLLELSKIVKEYIS
ncbi:MAG: response regulator [Candidatus Omnitrophota bacterium]